MNLDNELQRLATERENAYEAAIAAMNLDAADQLRRMRTYLARQEDRRRIKRLGGGTIQLRTLTTGVCRLECPSVEFNSGSTLDFRMKIEPQPAGRISWFEFHLNLPGAPIDMVRIELNDRRGHDLLRVPRCHLHLGRGAREGDVHIPFPIMPPLLILHLLCSILEPEFGR